MERNNKICIIMCYFGEMPEYFDFWLKSAAYNDDIDFLCVTDQVIKCDKHNIKVLNISLVELKEIIKNKLCIENIALEKPYKICDFRPAFGKIFEDYLQKYEFWGHCDIDLIFGNLRAFITKDILNENYKILENGNLSIYKNNEYSNMMFKKNGAIYSYTTVFTNNEFFAFDEFTGINKICKKNGISLYKSNICADIDPKYSCFCLVGEKNYKYQVFYFENGKIFKAFWNDKKNAVDIKEYSHIHFQKKKIRINCNIKDNFYITENGLEKKEEVGIPTIKQIKKFTIKKSKVNDIIIYFIKKIMHFYKINFFQKRIWIKQKIMKIKE